MTAGGKRIGAGRKPLGKDTKVMSIRVESKHHDDLKKLNLMIRSALETKCGTARDMKFIRARKFSDELVFKFGNDFV
jgi:hypothetical protein